MEIFNRLKEKCLRGEITFDEFWEEIILAELAELKITKEQNARYSDFDKIIKDYLRDSFEFQKSLLLLKDFFQMWVKFSELAPQIANLI